MNNDFTVKTTRRSQRRNRNNNDPNSQPPSTNRKVGGAPRQQGRRPENRNPVERSQHIQPAPRPKPQITINYGFHGALPSLPDKRGGLIRSGHVLYVKTGPLSYDEAVQAISILVGTANEIYHQTTNEYLSDDFHVNMPRRGDGSTLPFCYVWIAASPLHSILTGKNPDGSERIRYVPDPKWTPTSSPSSTKSSGSDGSSGSLRWADEDDEEEAPLIVERLPSLVGRLYVLHETGSEEQDTSAPIILTSSTGSSGSSPSRSTGSTNIDVTCSFAESPASGDQPNVICAGRVPDWITAPMVATAFSPYSTSSDRSYPQISFGRDRKGDRMVFITFDYTTTDAIFALQMMLKCNFIKPGPQPQTTASLIFAHVRGSHSK